MRLPRYWMVFLPLLFVAGCSTGNISDRLFSYESESLNVESDPAGADVYVMGSKVGVTPVRLAPSVVFPSAYEKKKEPLYGKIILKKSGCADSLLAVNADSMSKGLSAKLDCGDPKPAATNVIVPRLSENVEQRLKRVMDMREKGLISEEEAKALRARILNDF